MTLGCWGGGRISEAGVVPNNKFCLEVKLDSYSEAGGILSR